MSLSNLHSPCTINGYSFVSQVTTLARSRKRSYVRTDYHEFLITFSRYLMSVCTQYKKF